MKAIRVDSHGAPEVLKLAEVDPPSPGPGQLLVDVAASGVNFVDCYNREGRYPSQPPYVPGVEGAGTVAAVGPDVSEFKVGDHVGWVAAPGSYAEQVLVPAAIAIPIPEGVSDEIAAAVLLQGLTAHYLCTSTYPIQEGDVALVHAAAGGVGLLLTQMVKMRGGRVLGTVSTEEKAALARGAGADEVIRYDQVDFAAEARQLTEGAGVAVVFDGVGKTTFDGSLASLRPRGMMALFGGASGPVPPVDPMRLTSGGSLFLTRPTLVSYTLTRDELRSRARDVLGWVAAGRLHVRIGGRYPLSEARRAHEDLEGRRTTGKLLLPRSA
jgi:NADPH2:quinone reductase